MIVEPMQAQVIKSAIDAIHPIWRQVGISGEKRPHDPGLIIVEIDGVPHVIAAASSNEVFGGGHLTIEDWWMPGGRGAVVKGGGDHLLEDDHRLSIPGFIHLHRLSFEQSETGARGEAQRYFAEHPGEFSSFFPVIFERRGTDRYPWRALPR